MVIKSNYLQNVMENERLSQIVSDLPRRVFDKLRQYRASTSLSKLPEGNNSVRFKEWDFSIRCELLDRPREIYAGILTVNTSISNRVSMTGLPTRSRMHELIKLSPHIYGSLGLSSARIVRARQYIEKGELKFDRESDDNLGLPVPYDFIVRHRILNRKTYNPSDFLQAFWDLSMKPLIHCA